MKNNSPAIVIGGGVNALGVIRNLGRNGIDVYCVVEKKDEAIYSKYCKGYYVFPGIAQSKEKVKTFLTEFKRQMNCEIVVFPTSDLSVLNVSQVLTELTGFRIVLSDFKILETMIKKRQFYQSLLERNVPHPTTLFPDLKDSISIGKRLSFPVFIKPSVSQLFNKKFGKKGFVANSEKELHNYLQLMDKHKIDVMIQEIIPGTAENHFFIDGYFDKDSKPVALFARRRLRMWPLWFGNSSVCVSVPLSEVAEMKDDIVKYLGAIGYRGIFSAEFKRDPRDNVCKLIEVNARSWWYNSFPSACGVNIILMAYLDAVGVDVEEITDYAAGIHLINFLEDLKSSLAMISQKQLTFREWLTPLIRKKDMTVFARDDLVPFAMNFFQSIAEFANKEKRSRLLGSKSKIESK
ncbi:MAG: hypothetical protein CW691_06070 [Candidatus Bathyarchaeum sp.]|nr:MAG: hypothetical protein CW691_06070 [Candidatus Bathyarchaeum sp.]